MSDAAILALVGGLCAVGAVVAIVIAICGCPPPTVDIRPLLPRDEP